MKAKKHIGLEINNEYVEEIEDQLNKIKSIVALAERWSMDQENGLTPSSICVAALKDIRMITKETKK